MTHFLRVNLRLKRVFLCALFALPLVGPTYVHAQNCINDTIPPVMVCPQTVYVNLTRVDDPDDCYGPAGFQNNPPALDDNACKSVGWFHASVFGGDSYDECNFVRFQVSRTQPYSDAVLNLNDRRGQAPCNSPFHTFPTEYETGILKQDSIKFYCGEVGVTQVVKVLAIQVDADGNVMTNSIGSPIYGECLVNVELDTFFGNIQGRVFMDTLANCTYEPGENLLVNWKVKITGQITGDVFEVLTDSVGRYSVALNGLDTLVKVTLASATNFGQSCQSEYNVHVPKGGSATQDVPVQLEQHCGLLSVGLATTRLRRCFPNRYTVQACNLSSEMIPDTYTELTLDNYFDFLDSSIPGTWLSGNTYSFQLGNLASGECKTFTIDFTLSCNATLGATHCMEAHIFPYDDCSDNSSWSGADVEVNAVCDGDSVRFSISNVGNGDMTQILEFVVVEDVVMRQEDTFQLGIGQSLNFSHPANGSTWRLEAQEEPLHPWGGLQAVALEGCGGLNIPGLVNIFPLSNPNPFEALDCLENIGSYDPNDKQGFPIGFGNQHFVKANTDIEYLIRFQNTGTDTAFTVVVLDTISQNLDVASVRVQVASHPMEFAMLEGGILRFTFNNILLPDSNVNQVASNGFIKFRIAQKPDHPDGILLENSAAIYFDFNDPIITNTTLHTIGEEFLPVSTDDLVNDGLLRAFPNPASDAVMFELKEWANTGRFELTNNLGQQVSAQRFTGNKFRFERKNLPAGLYHFQILSGNVRVAAGKVVLK